MNNNKQDLFGEFMSAPTIPPPAVPIPKTTPTLNQFNSNIVIDNNILYKKLVDIEIEISNLKTMINQMKYPQPMYYPPVQGNMTQPLQGNMVQPLQGNIPQIWTNNTIWKDNQTQFRF